MLKCAPEKSAEFKTDPLLISTFTDCGWSSGSEKAKLISTKLSSITKLTSGSPVLGNSNQTELLNLSNCRDRAEGGNWEGGDDDGDERNDKK